MPNITPTNRYLHQFFTLGQTTTNNPPLRSVHILSKKSGKVCRGRFLNILLVAFSGLVSVV
jgi:hypothetical protein